MDERLIELYRFSSRLKSPQEEKSVFFKNHLIKKIFTYVLNKYKDQSISSNKNIFFTPDNTLITATYSLRFPLGRELIYTSSISYSPKDNLISILHQRLKNKNQFKIENGELEELLTNLNIDSVNDEIELNSEKRKKKFTLTPENDLNLTKTYIKTYEPIEGENTLTYPVKLFKEEKIIHDYREAL